MITSFSTLKLTLLQRSPRLARCRMPLRVPLAMTAVASVDIACDLSSSVVRKPASQHCHRSAAAIVDSIVADNDVVLTWLLGCRSRIHRSASQLWSVLTDATLGAKAFECRRDLGGVASRPAAANFD